MERIYHDCLQKNFILSQRKKNCLLCALYFQRIYTLHSQHGVLVAV